MNNDLWDIRRNYTSKPLNESTMLENPFDQFAYWLDEAKETDILDPLAATLATVSKEGFPAARIVLIKEITDLGFIFYTNYNSHKAHDIQYSPKACLNIYWDVLHRQVRITGLISKIPKSRSEAYFHSRPFESQIAAYISKQSQKITNRKELEDKFHEAYKEFKGHTVPHPEDWGGYCLTPIEFEFWQGLPSRLHDRIVYSHLNDSNWNKKRVSP